MPLGPPWTEADAIEDVLGQVVDLGDDDAPTPQAEALGAAVAEAKRAAPAPADRLSAVGGVIVRPGDILVIGTHRPITLEGATALRADMMERLPGIADVLVLSDTTVEAVYRGGPTP